MESLNALFEHATEGILICDSKGVISKANPACEKLFGYKSGELIGSVVEQLVPRRLSESHKRDRDKFVAQPHPRSMAEGIALHGRRKDETEFPVEISLSYFKQQGKQWRSLL